MGDFEIQRRIDMIKISDASYEQKQKAIEELTKKLSSEDSQAKARKLFEESKADSHDIGVD